MLHYVSDIIRWCIWPDSKNAGSEFLDGSYEGFSCKVGRSKTEGGYVMQSTTHGSSRDQGRMGQAAMMPASDSTTDDNSGLHDLKALASSTKQRRSQRLSSQMEAQDSLLQSAASLEAVALPAPSKEQPMSLSAVTLGDSPLASATVASSTATTDLAASSHSTIGTPPASLSKYLLLGGLALAAAAVAFYMMRGGASDGGNDESVTAANAIVTPLANEPEANEPEAVETTPAAAAVPVVVAAETLDEPETAELAVDDEAAELSADATDETAASDEVPVVVKETPKKGKTSKADPSTKSERAAAKTEAKAKRALAKAEKKAAKEAKKAAKAASGKPAPVLGEGGASLDDVLSSVTGGINKPIVEEKDDKPSKKRLERGDISKAMKAISSAAKSCYSVEEFSGSVMVKYSVAPSGTMTKAVGMGAHKSSKTGKCVVKAVKKAKFPAFSGVTQSFTFPFLLSP